MYEADIGSATIFLDTKRTARKTHRCDECARTIEPKEQYHFVSGIWEGEFNSHKTCAHCQVGQRWLQQQCHGFILGMSEEDLHEHFEEYNMFCLGKAVVGMRRKWKRFDGAGLMKIPKMPHALRA